MPPLRGSGFTHFFHVSTKMSPLRGWWGVFDNVIVLSPVNFDR
jgi:hypothetical protein